MALTASKSVHFIFKCGLFHILCVYLTQKELSGRVCVPVLCGRRCDVVLPGETVRYLQRLKICDSLLLWREDVDLMKLHHTRRLSLTMLRDGLLDR